MMNARICRSILSRTSLQRRFVGINPAENPGNFIEGVTKEDLKKDEELAAFFKYNFTDKYNLEKELEKSSVQEMKEKKIAKQKEANASPLNIRKMHCYLRDTVEEEGSRRSDWLREVNLEIPGLLYGSDPTIGINSEDDSSKIYVKTPWNVLERETDIHRRAFESRVYDLTVYEDYEQAEEGTGGTVHRVVPTSVRWHPVKNKLFCANYLRYHAGRPIQIPIMYINEEESPSMKRGGYIAPINRFVSCYVDEGVRIPDFLELECTGLELKEVVRIDRVSFPDGVRMSRRVKEHHRIIGTVFGARADGSDEDDDENNSTEETASE